MRKLLVFYVFINIYYRLAYLLNYIASYDNIALLHTASVTVFVSDHEHLFHWSLYINVIAT